MAHETVLTVFVIVAAVAIVVQALLLFGVYQGVRSIHREVEGVRADVKLRLDPLTQSVTEILANSREPVRTITANLAEISRVLRDRTSHVDSLVADLVDRSRLQVIRVDQMVSDLVTKVETTAEVVQRQVLAPVHEVSALITGVRSGLEFLFSRRRGSKVSEAAQEEQLFI